MPELTLPALIIVVLVAVAVGVLWRRDVAIGILVVVALFWLLRQLA